MTIPSARDSADTDPGEAAVADFLREHPDFFVRHAALLAQLRLPHASGGPVISLVERQVDVLRERAQALEARLAELVGVARSNEQLVGRFHQLTRRLLGAASAQDAAQRLEQSLREDFDVSIAQLLVLSGVPGLTDSRFVRRVDAKDPGLAGLESLFASGKPRCGLLRDTQRDFLFGAAANDIGSIALIPLGSGPAFGLLALASSDRHRFNPGMSTDFLSRLAELVGDALQRG